MAIEPVTELGNGSALRLPHARVVPLSAPPSSYIAAVERYLTGAGIAKSSVRIYRISLTTWGWMLAGEPAPTGPARRGAKPPAFPLAAIDDPALPKVLAELAAARTDEMDADTVNRPRPSALSGGRRRPTAPRALAENQIAALWRLDIALREKTFWKMLCESAARAYEVLCLDLEDLYPQDKRGRITAQLLPRLIARRTRGPLFLTGRKAVAGNGSRSAPSVSACGWAGVPPFPGVPVPAARQAPAETGRGCAMEVAQHPAIDHVNGGGPRQAFPGSSVSCGAYRLRPQLEPAAWSPHGGPVRLPTAFSSGPTPLFRLRFSTAADHRGRAVAR
ncbi:hypothetical protein AB0L14_28090 [Streptomyces sp. NPDC052727]|uniref:hypothetical protein n=1 Tax=Streptomyces sp. NPDC052727 TaxID=3154854 RepID=UPI00342B697A